MPKCNTHTKQEKNKSTYMSGLWCIAENWSSILNRKYNSNFSEKYFTAPSTQQIQPKATCMPNTGMANYNETVSENNLLKQLKRKRREGGKGDWEEGVGGRGEVSLKAKKLGDDTCKD